MFGFIKTIINKCFGRGKTPRLSEEENDTLNRHHPTYGTIDPQSLNADQPPLLISSPTTSGFKKCLLGLRYGVACVLAGIATPFKALASGGQRVFAMIAFCKALGWQGLSADLFSGIMGTADFVVMLMTRIPAIFGMFFKLILPTPQKLDQESLPATSRPSMWRRLGKWLLTPLFSVGNWAKELRKNIRGRWKYLQQFIYASLYLLCASSLFFVSITGFLGGEFLASLAWKNAAFQLSMGGAAAFASLVSFAAYKLPKTFYALKKFFGFVLPDLEKLIESSSHRLLSWQNILLFLPAVLDAASQFCAFWISQEDLRESSKIEFSWSLFTVEILFALTSTIQYVFFNWPGLFKLPSSQKETSTQTPGFYTKFGTSFLSLFTLLSATICQSALSNFNTKNAILRFSDIIQSNASDDPLAQEISAVIGITALVQMIPMTIFGSGALLPSGMRFFCLLGEKCCCTSTPSEQGMFSNTAGQERVNKVSEDEVNFPLLYPPLPTRV